MVKETLGQKLTATTKGIAATLSDYLLIQLSFWLEMMASPGDIYKLSDRAVREFPVRKTQTRRAVGYLKKKGMVAYSRGGSDPRITRAGKRRLATLLPSYDQVRHWDQKLYLVVYDIPEKKKVARETLRDYLKKIGCGMLQNSVWITPYDPREVLRKFVFRWGLVGQVLIGDLGRGNRIGGESWEELLDRVYSLSALNRRYQRFLTKYSKEKEPLSWIAIDFLAVLGDDPQLPFVLLPKNWLGGKAYTLYKSRLRSQVENVKLLRISEWRASKEVLS